MKDNALYLEVDEDITSAIDKLSKVAAGSVQIVVPKRSTMLQSIINLKLLKKAADNASKELVLVTNDRIATELAARVGLAVAPSLGAKAVIGEANRPEALNTNEEIIEADDPEPDTPVPSPAVPVAPKVSKRPLLKRKSVSDGPPAPVIVGPAIPVATSAAASAAAPSGPKVPNFNRLQRRVIWLGLGVFLIVGYIGAMYFLTSAKVILYAAGSKVSIDTNFTVDPDTKSSDAAKAVLAGQNVTLNKDLTGSFVPSGKKDVGTKAHGTITFKNCEDSNVYPLSAGNTLTAQGVSFVTDEAVQIPGGTFSGGGKNCTSPTVTVAATAAQNGDTFNVTNATFKSGKLSENFQISGSMSGGTTKTVNVVSQSDVDSQKAALLEKDKDNAARDLKGKAPTGYVLVGASEKTSGDAATSLPAVGSEGDTATLTVKAVYSALAVKESEYKDFIHALEEKQVGDKSQIYDDGLSAAQTTAGEKDSSGRQTFHLTTEAYSGVKLDQAAIAAKVKGQRYGDAVNTAAGQPGVSRAEVSIWPAWVSSMPSRTNKISVTIQVAQNK